MGLAVVGLGLALLLVPLAARGSDVPAELRTWRASYRLTSFVGIHALYLIGLWGGLSIAVASVETLFELDVRGEIYGHLTAWIFAMGAPWMVAARTEEIYAFEEEVGAESLPWMTRMGFYLTLPLVSVYLIITYAYALRVLFTDYAPSNVISPLILGAGLLMLAAREQVEPMRRKGGFETLVRVVDALPVAVVPVVPLAIWAVFTRIDQYGWTEFRYVRLVVLLALLVICGVGAVAYLRRRPMRLWAVPAVFAGFALVGAIGPLSAPAVAERSQVGRLEVQAAELGVLDAQGKIDAGQVAAKIDEGGAELATLAIYVRDHFGDEALRDFASEEFSPRQLAGWENQLAEARWLYPKHDYESTVEPSVDKEALRAVELRAEPAPLEVERAATLYTFSHLHSSTDPQSRVEHAGEEALMVSTRDATLEVQLGDALWQADLSPQLAAAREFAGATGELHAELRRVVLYDAQGQRGGEVVIEMVRVRIDGAQVELARVAGTLVVDR